MSKPLLDEPLGLLDEPEELATPETLKGFHQGHGGQINPLCRPPAPPACG